MQEDVGLASIGLRVTDIPLISDQFANADAGYLPNLFTNDTTDSAVGMYACLCKTQIILSLISDGEDYDSLSMQVQITFNAVLGFVIMPPTVMVMVINDDIPEDQEQVALVITSGPAIGTRDIIRISPETALLIIEDNDGIDDSNKISVLHHTLFLMQPIHLWWDLCRVCMVHQRKMDMWKYVCL